MGGLRIEQQGDILHMGIDGELTQQAVPQIRKRCDKLLEASVFTHLVVDLSEVPFIDSSGIGLLVSVNSRLKGSGKHMVLFRPSDQAIKTLHLVQLLDFFTIVKNEDDLLVMTDS
ncbi:STAS domain-containing protein [Oleidesulfovibrio sp.]|uniref:STAS domain-containing protein n=1 Tax=Oleidesulfovibrio sp. TaxID=2909707 RepID=UPI003A84AA82